MRESWRWFGPNDPVTINDIRQTGATDVTSALHNIPTGEVWPIEAIRKHQALIEDCEPDLSPLKWSVVESIPVHEDIKLALLDHQTYIDSWIASMENLARCGIKTICYNFSLSGLASNVMVYIAKLNLALSVTLTATATLLASITTPLLMKVFAGEYIPIDFWAMMLSSIKIVILPIIAGLVFNHLLHGKAV